MNNPNSYFFVAINKYNSVNEWTAIMGNIFDTSSVELTIGHCDQLEHLVDLANSEGFQYLPRNAVLNQYKRLVRSCLYRKYRS